MRIALASAELYPLSGGGIGQFSSGAARLLSEAAEVTVLTSSANEAEYERLRGREDPRLPPPSVRVAFVEAPSLDPEACEGFFSPAHLYSARAYERLRELYPDGGPDLIEFGDFLGEGCVTVQAAAALDPFLERTAVCVRGHTAGEICEVLNGALPTDFPTRATFALERLSLFDADRLLWGGGDVLGTYRRFYGGRLAPAKRVRHPYHGPAADPGDDSSFRAGEPLRLLYAGRLERRKGVHQLLQAASGLERDDFRLTLVGADTPTAPLGVSMRDQLELSAADDERIEIRHPLPREELAELIRAHDAVLLPSLWECWPYAALEAMHLNRPVLATPVGGLAEMVVDGRSGWQTAGTDPESLAAGLEGLLDRRAELETIVREGRPAEVARSLAEPGQIVEAYEALAADGPRRRRRRRPKAAPPLVSAVVPYHATAEFVRETVSSLCAQTYPRLEIILINDGSFEESDWVLAELAARFPITVLTQPNRGLGAARNFGIRSSRGRYVFPLDADDAAEPAFVERCVEVLESRPELSFASSWSRYIEPDGGPPAGVVEGWQPLGIGFSPAGNRLRNIAGSAAALLRRRVFDLGFSYSEELTSYEDWHLYRELERAGHLGAVIPERLLVYRIHPASMMRRLALSNHDRLEAEIEARIRENSLQWTLSSA